MNQDELRRVLLDRNLAQLGDSILNFALSATLTQVNGRPTGRRVKNSIMTPLIDSSPLKTLLPLRTSRRNRANAFEALAGHLWLKGTLEIEDLIDAMVKSGEASVGDLELERLSMQVALKVIVDKLEAQKTQVTY